MRVSNIKDMTRGWFIGDFEPSMLRTKAFEVGVLTHKKGEQWPTHYHKKAAEYNVLLEGSMTVNGQLLQRVPRRQSGGRLLYGCRWS